MRRGWKILAILVFGFLMMCVGALGGALGVINFYRLFPGLAPAPTITATPVVASIPTPLASPAALPTLSAIATLRPIPTVLATAGGNVLTPTLSAVEAISPTVAAPAATSELTPSVVISPTTTETPTAAPAAVAAADTPAPAPQAVETPPAATATFTPRPPTRTPTPSATPTRKRLLAPELVAPSDNEQVSVCDGIGRCNIKFEWRSNVILAENEWFDLRVWRKDEPHRGVARVKSSSAIVDFFAYRPDRYFWTVVIVQVDVSGRTEDLSPEQPVFDPQTRQAIFWSVTK